MIKVLKRLVLWTGFSQLIRGILAGLLAYVSLVPFYYFQSQSLTLAPSFSLIKYWPFVLVCSACGLWVVEWRLKGRGIIPMTVGRWICTHLALSLLSLWGAEYARIGLEKWIYYHATGPVLCLLVVQYFSSWDVIRRGAIFMVLLGGAVVVYTFFFSATGLEPFWDAIQRAYSPYHTRHRAMGPFGHTVATATYAMFLLSLAVWALTIFKGLWSKVGWGLVCALFVPTVLVTQTRGTQVATLLCCVLLVPWLKKFGPAMGRIGRRKLYGGLIACGLAALVMGGGLMQHERIGNISGEIGQRWREILEPRSVTIRDGDKVYQYDSLLAYTERFRIAQYYTVGNMLAEHPFMGVGFGTFTREFEKYRYAENYMVREFPEHTTENMYLMFLAETGVLGLSARLALMTAIFVAVFGAWRRAEPGPRRDLLWAYLAGYAGLAANMLTWDVLNEPTLRMVYWLWTGLALSAARLQADLGGSVVGVADEAA